MKVLITDKINEAAVKIVAKVAEVDNLPTMEEDELVKQLKILNTLIFLDAQYHNTDSIMTMKEIQNEYIKVGHKLLKENKE